MRTRIFSVGIAFRVDDRMDPPNDVIHEALKSLRGLEIEATNNETAEHYADVIRLALEKAAS